MITITISTLVAIAAFALGNRFANYTRDVDDSIQNIYEVIHDERREFDQKITDETRHRHDSLERVFRALEEIDRRIDTVLDAKKGKK